MKERWKIQLYVILVFLAGFFAGSSMIYVLKAVLVNGYIKGGCVGIEFLVFIASFILAFVFVSKIETFIIKKTEPDQNSEDTVKKETVT